ncbi:bifunctional 3-(3-hydroxy-phenyl)propionate/3-hydroxycinnamic acid hydroxylase [Pseudorhodoplanes sinuspersici]|uniref:bifunctional 3-(3-hydroxy-phenyl)propionate/3-hydroxycinnamic acid hydroxylase n=1 Tax=Pseudorhodoplanes sinuspersici TaxID=1235591 RepID=UPI000FF4CB1A|nr:bifunctional 3-(3-hydroxy-phenyl)propionate/3-hydroxycinnamic acid hydroxylase [Pseudorhodoplanes sinuspersici]RKE68369.1 3-(3-hydroxy-phenyl)propionate hydroxylase [Pseudorhodoplanes sinuspersici]
MLEKEEYDLIVVGAGPVGMMIANLVGPSGLRVLILEQLPSLIDYPRGVGMDDECLRVFQSAGLVEKAIPFTFPNQWLDFRTARGRTFAMVKPKGEAFGFPKRNAFIQPLIDRVLLEGLVRYKNVEMRLGYEMTGLSDNGRAVHVTARAIDGEERRFTTSYLVGCDGGRSLTRKLVGIPFEGQTESTRWLVIDIKNDPIGVPSAILVCDPSRPYVTIALPHGIRRLEFMVKPNETEEELCSTEGLKRILSIAMPDPASARIIRSRVYTHHARLAKAFRAGRVLLAGDAAHLMPVWQGQGYNSGIRDANNLSWKLISVLRDGCDPTLLDTYETERREHARAMISLSTLVGRIFSPTSWLLASFRDVVFGILNRIPPVRDYVVQMRFKPMPKYTEGVVVGGVSSGRTRNAVGRLFVQPRVALRNGSVVRLDDAIGYRFAIVAWAADPCIYMNGEARRVWSRLNGTTVVVRSQTELMSDTNDVDPETVLVGDVSGGLKEWFATEDTSVAILRPDRFVAAVCRPQEISRAINALGRAMRMQSEKGVPYCTNADNNCANVG